MKVRINRKTKKQFKRFKEGFSQEIKEFKGSYEKHVLIEREPLFYNSSKGHFKYLRKAHNTKTESYKGCNKQVFWEILNNPKEQPSKHLCFMWLK